MFAFFNLGVQELIILGPLGLVAFGVVVAILLFVVLSNRGSRSDNAGDR